MGLAMEGMRREREVSCRTKKGRTGLQKVNFSPMCV